MQQQLLDDVPYIVPYYSGDVRGMADRHVHWLAGRQPDLRSRGAGDADGSPSDGVGLPITRWSIVARRTAANGRRRAYAR